MWNNRAAASVLRQWLVQRRASNLKTLPWTTTVCRRAPPQRRTYMDAKTRPSHSGMFQRDGSAPSSKLPSPSHMVPEEGVTESSSFSLYLLMFSRAAMAAGFIYGFTEYICDITLCEGPSMAPTLQPAGEIVLIDKFTLRRKGVADGCRGTARMRAAVQRQEAFVASESSKTNGKEEFWYEQRISVSDLDPPTWGDLSQLLSTPLSVGDVVVVNHPFRKGTVCKRVVGLPGDTVLKPRSGLLVIPDGHVWLEGDNPVNSADSRTYGTVPLALVQGRVLFRVWPLRGAALLQRGAPPRHEVTGFTILPAGYEGQQINKHKENEDVDK